MTLFKYDKGVTITGQGELIIYSSSPFWELPEDEKLNALKRYRSLYKHAWDAFLIGEHLNFTKGNPLARRIDDQFGAIASFQNAPNNPLLSEKVREFCRAALEFSTQAAFQQKRRRTADKSLKTQVVERDQHRCRYCGADVPKTKERAIDHVIPYSLGGLTDYDNLVVACLNCNRKKAGRTPEQAGMVLLSI